jgi:hypothetical protein
LHGRVAVSPSGARGSPEGLTRPGGRASSSGRYAAARAAPAARQWPS